MVLVHCLEEQVRRILHRACVSGGRYIWLSLSEKNNDEVGTFPGPRQSGDEVYTELLPWLHGDR